MNNQPRCINDQCPKDCARKTAVSGWIEQWKADGCVAYVPVFEIKQLERVND